MGQQQLLLLVLGIVIVGVAVIIGITAFAENNKKANVDSLVNDGIRIATDAQAWMLKPSIYGGGGNSCGADSGCDWTLVDFQRIGYELDASGNYTNVNGTFELDASSASELIITGTSAAAGNQVTVVVSGLGPNELVTTVDVNYAETTQG
jgi:hypothetical protein